ncbi:CCA tRNA nucleotidyltransferase [Cohnella sp. CFH 77786]|uniref:CCA tRNA nucleotidyltransferase n=1 Tax=Cohnella sp. CFH 77786 TaxID=2662265 RepID=UPI001C6100C5|nr:CCA tRNA nucleotidyltransferase [Cohnella sp. CFH 77786]MBW5446605.1 CCA tRNA nucleotidyltransferase [Cohnella sp. CFH 77786]
MTESDEELWSAGMEVVQRLGEHGHEAYLVGGCVRDRLLGRPLHDVDIATSALPEEVMAAFDRTIPTGLQHGTVTVMFGGRPFEVTTYRTESGYTDARRPDKVAFVRDIREDLARRDFTFNAMAAGLNGEWIDPFGGRNDLAEGIVRCVGEARERFGEDALRMVRAIRFAAGFGFRVALSVWRGIRSQGPRLRQVAMERIGSEWDKMMEGADPARACSLFGRSGLLLHLKEPLPPAVMAGLQVSGPAAGIRPLLEIADTDVRWIAWLAGTGAHPEDAARFCKALKFSGKRETRIAKSLSFHRAMPERGADVRRAFLTATLDFGRAAALDWLSMKVEGAKYQKWLDELPAAKAAQLAVRGDELVRHAGMPAGPWVSHLLRHLLEETAFGRLANEKNALLRAAETYIVQTKK